MSTPDRPTAIIIATILLLITGLLQSAQAMSLPDNSDPYADIKRISMAELQKHPEQYLVIDVRTDFEYQLLHIKGAINIPHHKASFNRLLRETAGKNDKTLVFYCNASRDTAFQAARAAKISKLPQTYVMVEGPLAWAKAHPQLTLLRGKTLAGEADLISDKEFTAHNIDAMDFETRIKTNPNVLDLRGYRDREGVSIFMGFDKWTPLEKPKSLHRALEKMAATGKPLYIYDDRGARTRWLQYTLKEMGIKEYYFMRGGAREYNRMISEMHKGQWSHGQYQAYEKNRNDQHGQHQMADGHSGHSQH